MNRIYVDRYTGRLERTDLYLVRLTLKDGTVYDNLEPRRLFPFTNPTMYITLLDKDEHEIALVRDLTEIDDQSVKALEECFKDIYLIPKIVRLVSYQLILGRLFWDVETDRGPISFQIPSVQNDIKGIPGTTRIIIRDSNDNRYEIPDLAKMDKRSQRMIGSFY